MNRGLLAALGDPGLVARVNGAARVYGLKRIEFDRDFHLFAGPGLHRERVGDGAVILGECFPPLSGSCDAGSGWGSWLSFRLTASGSLGVARAALTGLPLYWASCDAGLVFFSHLELALAAGIAPSLDIDFLRHQLAYQNLRTERTGIVDVRELLPGMSLAVSNRDVKISCDWSPWRFAALAHSRGSAALEIEHTIDACVAAWAASRPEILLELSGGLDSSIVAAALSASGARFGAINVATSSPDGDERRYARAVAACLGIGVAEVLHAPGIGDLTHPPAFPSPRPSSFGALLGVDTALGSAASAGASLFSGIGGDNVFALNRSVAPVLDALQLRGPGQTALLSLVDLARLANVSVWHALRLCMRQWRRGTPATWPRGEDYVPPGALASEPFSHPWDAGAHQAPYGKRLQVQAIRRILDFLDRPARWYDRDVVAPLLSQPVVELCLSIPSWDWIAGGHDRAAARAAFANRLPSEVAWRRGKGRLETMCAQIFIGQRATIRELLLEGRLAREGLVDRERAEAYLARDRIDGDYDYFRLLELADIERWIASLP